MIKNKNQLKIRLKEDKESLVFITLKNDNFPETIGKPRKANIIQTNAFTLSTKRDGKIIDSWIYYTDIKVKDNVIMYLDEQNEPIIKMSIVELINVPKKYYDEYPDDYKTIVDGIPYILRLEQNEGTVLTPVRIIEGRNDNE